MKLERLRPAADGDDADQAVQTPQSRMLPVAEAQLTFAAERVSEFLRTALGRRAMLDQSLRTTVQQIHERAVRAAQGSAGL